MIDVKIWKKYTAQVDLINEMRSADTDRVNKKMREDHEKGRAEHNARCKAAGWWMPYPMCGYCLPVYEKKTVEGCLDWMAEGMPTKVKKLKVKSV